MSEETPKPKLIVKQPTKDVRINRAGTVTAQKNKVTAKKAAAKTVNPTKKNVR